MTTFKQTLDKVLVDLMVDCMLNPENEELYVGRLSLSKAESLCNNMCNKDTTAIDIFWRAFHIAEEIVRDEQQRFEEFCRNNEF